MSNEERIDKWIKEREDSDVLCEFCKYEEGCHKDMACYGGVPIEPYCAERGPKEFLDMDAILEDIKENESGRSTNG